MPHLPVPVADMEHVESRHAAICDWIERINPTMDHINALKLRDDHTYGWFLRQKQWQDFLAGSHRLIWIHGIPGAGKTILASYIIEQIIAISSKLAVTNSCLYFYCSYRHTDDQASSFLRWIVSQLCRQLKCVPQEVIQLHEMRTEATMTDLKKALSILLEQVGLVYVVIDAIDECNTTSNNQTSDAADMRQDFLGLMKCLLMQPEFARMKIIATSREYTDIQDALRNLSAPISMSNPLVDEDIRKYVNSQLHSIKSFEHWSPNLLHEVAETLVIGAKGM
jgi:hypothetical protein